MKKGEVVGKQLFGKNVATQRKKYSELFMEFINQLEIKGRAEQTIKTYKYHNKYFMEYLGEDIYCDQITIKTIENYIKYTMVEKGLRNGITINKSFSDQMVIPP